MSGGLNFAWYFETYAGYQDAASGQFGSSALAVSPGQVCAVPLPASAWLLLSALDGLGLLGRRRGESAPVNNAA